MTLDEIKQLMAAGETAEADEALKEVLARTVSENLQAKMFYGTCRQLLGDEETFKRIHDELAPLMTREQYKWFTEKATDWLYDYNGRLKLMVMDDFGYFPMTPKLRFICQRWREIRTHGLKRGRPHRNHRGGTLYSTQLSRTTLSYGRTLNIQNRDSLRIGKWAWAS